MGRYGEIWEREGHREGSEPARYGEIWGDVGREKAIARLQMRMQWTPLTARASKEHTPGSEGNG